MTHWAFFSPGVEPCRLHLKHQKILIKVTFVHCSMHLLFTAQCRKGLCSSSWFPIHYSLAGIQLDYETWIPGDVYKSWLNDASSLISKRQQVNTVCVCATDYCFYWFRCLHDPLKLLFKMDLQKFDIVQSTNLNDLMNTPPLALSYYPKPLMQLWRKCTGATSPENSGSEDNGEFNELSGISLANQIWHTI